MSIPIRNAVRVLLLNDKNQLLLMCVEGFDISTVEGKHNKRFWCTIGGKIEEGESIQEAAIREIYEETGIGQADIQLGPVVWQGDVDLMLKGILTCLQEIFIVARTYQQTVSCNNLTEDEQKVVKELCWFTLEQLEQSDEVIFPILLPQYLPDILLEKYPQNPLKIDLNVEPKPYKDLMNEKK